MLTLRLSLSVGRPLENRQFDMDLLPPATKLQGYIFTGVCDSVHRGSASSRGEGGASSRGVPSGDPPPRTATAAGGTHPTGMYSCFLFSLSTAVLFLQVCTTAFHYQKIQTHFIKCANYRPQRSWGKVIFSEACV